MFEERERDIVARDPGLRGLRLALDAAALVDALPESLLEASTGVRRTYVRYKPGVSCLAAYSFDTTQGERKLYVRAQARLDAKLDPGRAFRVADTVAVFPFPLDRRLRALESLMWPDPREALLTALDVCGSLSGSSAPTTLNYKPERRWVGRVETAAGTYALKLYRPGTFRAVREATRAFRSTESLQIPRVVGTSPSRTALLASEWCTGDSLAESICRGSATSTDLARTGAALAELHAQTPERLAHRHVDARARQLVAIVDNVAFIAPELEQPARALLSRGLAALGCEETHSSAIHGDFYAKQVLCGERITILDLDDAGRGDPAQDLGLFVAHLELEAARGRISPAAVRPLEQAFLGGYGDTIDPARVSLHCALGLLSLLHHPFRHADPAWPARMDALLSRAAARLPEALPRALGVLPARTRTKVDVQDAFGVTRDASMPYLRSALRPEQVERKLKEAGLHDLTVRTIRVLRHKPGRRCVIEYGFDGPEGRSVAVAKARARGLDRRTYDVATRLQAAGLGRGSASGVSISEPLGTIPDWNLWLQRRVPGTGAMQRLQDPDAADVARRIAMALVTFHRTRVSCTRQHSLADELSVLSDRLGALAARRPQLAPRVDRLLRGCEMLARSVRPAVAVGIHRDFYPDQVIVAPRRVHIIDLDLYAWGDPALDAGNFSGHLIEYALRHPTVAGRLGEARSSFESTYLAAPHSRSPSHEAEALALFTTLTLARHVELSTRFERRRAFTEPLLECCEKRLALRGAD